MDELLSNYTERGKFTFVPPNSLKICCDAPKDKSGVYLFYNISGNVRELIYIGCSGHITNGGILSTRKSGMGGLMGRIVNGHQFNKRQRWLSLPEQMIKDSISKLEVEWYVTHNNETKHSPIFVESCLLQNYYDSYNKLPKWNLKF
jgi:hypothetical protein